MSLVDFRQRFSSSRQRVLTRIPPPKLSSETLRWLANEIFWFLTLVSWLPMIASLQEVLIKVGQGDPVFAVRPNFIPFLVIAFGILASGLAAGFEKRPESQRPRIQHPLVLVICVIPAFVAVIISRGTDNLAHTAFEDWERAWVLPSGYCSVALSALCFITCGRLRSLATLLFCLLAAIEAFAGLFSLGAEPSIGTVLTFGRLFSAYHLSVLDLLIVSSLIVLGRFLFRIWIDNKPGFRQVKSSLSLASIWLTIWLAIPFFGFIIASSYVWNVVGEKVRSQLIVTLASDPSKTLEDAFQKAAARERETTKAQGLAAVAKAKGSITAGSAGMVAAVQVIDENMPPYVMQLNSCGWNVFCHAMNGFKSIVNSIYRKAKAAAIGALDAKLRRINEIVETSAGQRQVEANKALEDLNIQSDQWIKAAIGKSFQTARWIGMILSIYGLMIMVKTVMVILARIVYRDDPVSNKVFASLRPGGTKSVSTSPVVEGQEVDLPDDTYVVLRYEVRNAVPIVTLPQPVTGMIGRIVSGCYVLGKLNGTKPKPNGPSIVVNAPAELVTWKLGQGEEIVVRYGDLVAFSSSVRLATEVNLSLQATLFGRFIFHKARGPGLVVMRTEGEAVAGRSRDIKESRRATSLKAWDLSTGFQIQSTLNWRGLYFAPFNIRKEASSSRLIYDAGPKNTRWSPIGLIKATRTFLLPF